MHNVVWPGLVNGMTSEPEGIHMKLEDSQINVSLETEAKTPLFNLFWPDGTWKPYLVFYVEVYLDVCCPFAIYGLVPLVGM